MQQVEIVKEQVQRMREEQEYNQIIAATTSPSIFRQTQPAPQRSFNMAFNPQISPRSKALANKRVSKAKIIAQKEGSQLKKNSA